MVRHSSGYAGRPYTQPLVLIDMFAGKLPTWVESTLGASRIAVPRGRQRPCAKTWKGVHPPDMPTTAPAGPEPEPSKPTALNHHGGPVAAATARTRPTPAPIIASREMAIEQLWSASLGAKALTGSTEWTWPAAPLAPSPHCPRGQQL
jgi:hypothetical protein